jgi:hypothetical protein
MLALSAQDLADDEPQCQQLQQTALSYRVKSITALNEAISRSNSSVAQGNAMLATCFVLLFQSVLLEDGLVEYMSFMRGIIAVCIHMGTRNVKFLFANMLEQTGIVQASLQEAPLINPELPRGACRSLERFATLIENPREIEYFECLLSMARNLFTSSADGKRTAHPSPIKLI